MINREKIVFLLSCLISITSFIYCIHCLPKVTTIREPEAAWKNWNRFQRQNIFLQTAFRLSKRDIFTKIDEKKSMPPVYLAIPKIPSVPKISLPPIPAPSPKYWSRFRRNRFHDDNALPKMNLQIKHKSRKIFRNKFSKLTKEIQGQAHTLDIIYFRNKTKIAGKIIHKTSGKIVVNTKQQTLSFDKSEILKIEYAISPKEICKKKFSALKASGINDENCSKLLALARSAKELNLDSISIEIYRFLIQNAKQYEPGYIAFASHYMENLDIDKAYYIYTQSPVFESTIIARANVEASFGKDVLETSLYTLSRKTSTKTLLKSIELAFYSKKENILRRLAASLPKIEEDGSIASVNKEFLPFVYYWSARFALYNGDVNRCLELCKYAQAHLADEKTNLISLLDNLHGVAFYLKGDLQEAHRYLKKASSHSVCALYNLSLVYFAADEIDTAIKILKHIQQKEILANPSILFSTMAYFRYKQNPKTNFSEAKRLIEKSFRLNPQSFLNLYFKSEIGSLSSTEWMEAYRGTNEDFFSCSYIILKLALQALKTKNIPDAHLYLQELRDPERIQNFLVEAQSQIFSFSALACFLSPLKGQKKEDISFLQKSLSLNPHNLFALKLSAWFYNHKGETKKALDFFDSI